MTSNALKLELKKAAVSYARKRELPIDDSYASAVIFRNIADNFHPESYVNIIGCPDWRQRITKVHQTIAGVLEMQSSNSSDALLMNILCHPDIRKWKGVEDLLGGGLGEILFGFPAQVGINGGQHDSTEIDMALADTFFEAKLTCPNYQIMR